MSKRVLVTVRFNLSNGREYFVDKYTTWCPDIDTVATKLGDDIAMLVNIPGNVSVVDYQVSWKEVS